MQFVSDQFPGRSSSSPPQAIPREVPWTGIVWFGALLIIGSFPILRHLVEQWATDEDVNHGFLVPVAAAWIA